MGECHGAARRWHVAKQWPILGTNARALPLPNRPHNSQFAFSFLVALAPFSPLLEYLKSICLFTTTWGRAHPKPSTSFFLRLTLLSIFNAMRALSLSALVTMFKLPTQTLLAVPISFVLFSFGVSVPKPSAAHFRSFHSFHYLLNCCQQLLA